MSPRGNAGLEDLPGGTDIPGGKDARRRRSPGGVGSRCGTGRELAGVSGIGSPRSLSRSGPDSGAGGRSGGAGARTARGGAALAAVETSPERRDRRAEIELSEIRLVGLDGRERVAE